MASVAVDGRVPVGEGLHLQQAEDRHVDGIVRIETDAFGPADGPGILAAIDATGSTEDWLVVVDDDDTVVSASGLLDHVLLVDGCPLPAGQIEWVATMPAYQRRGLVRAQFDRHHAVSAQRGHLVQLIAGIPYLYRRFGYGYGIEHPALYALDPKAVTPKLAPDGVAVRLAEERDLHGLAVLEEQRTDPLTRMQRSERTWRRWLLPNTLDGGRYERLVVATEVGAGEDAPLLAMAHLKVDAEIDKRLYIEPAISRSAAATDAVVAHGLDLASQHGDLFTVAYDSAGSVHGTRLAELGSALRLFPGYYVRIPDPAAVLDALRGVLSARLAASDQTERSGTLGISLFNDGVELDHADGAVTAVRRVPGVEDPLAASGVGVAPDWFGALVLGRWGARQLEARIDDVLLGRHGRLMDALFPVREVDIALDL